MTLSDLEFEAFLTATPEKYCTVNKKCLHTNRKAHLFDNFNVVSKLKDLWRSHTVTYF